jgi:D-lactate dehydrogenase (cytochrome)
MTAPAVQSPESTRRASPAVVASVTEALAAAFGNRLVTSRAVREQHANTVTWIRPQAPDAVVFPHDADEVAAIVRLCAQHRMPVIAFGTGTSLEGHTSTRPMAASASTSAR